MVDPQVRYVQTGDGVNIAFATFGSGTPLVWLPDFPFTHLQLEWNQPTFRSRYEAVSANMMLVRYDARGSGMSDRRVEDLSLSGLVKDLEAVVDHLGLGRFAIAALQNAGVVAMAYAVSHVDRVSHLVLMNCYARAADYLASPQLQAATGAMMNDWELFTETVGALVFGYRTEHARDYGDFIRACVDREALTQLIAQSGTTDVTSTLPQIKAPTLIVHHSSFRLVGLDLARELATRIPGARLVEQGGDFFESSLDYGRLVAEFTLNKTLENAEAPGAFRTVLFTDLVGHTEMMQRLGDDRGRDVLREHERITRETLRAHGGAEVKTMGDGFMASFGSVTKAMDCAIALQRAFANVEPPSPLVGEGLGVRAGLNAGEPIEEDGDLFGSTVILASRIAAQAGAGEILIPEPLRHLLSGKSYVYADRGETMLKGFEDAVRLYEVRWRE